VKPYGSAPIVLISETQLRIALIVGTILFSINQLDVVLAGRATLGVWLKGGLTYLVPFCVSNWGILVATRRSQEPMKEAS
jgi:hypothetical protein